jgi:5-methylcytosine-specific restriction endonuclease McrA
MPCSKCGGIDCTAHAPNYDANRAKSDPLRKLWGSVQWQATRRRFRAEHPMCALCGEAFTEHVDHIIPARQYVAQAGCHDEDDQLRAFCNERNLQGLCANCHNSKKQREERQSRSA